MPNATSDTQTRRRSDVISSSVLRASRSDPPGQYSITRPRNVLSVVTTP